MTFFLFFMLKDFKKRKPESGTEKKRQQIIITRAWCVGRGGTTLDVFQPSGCVIFQRDCTERANKSWVPVITKKRAAEEEKCRPPANLNVSPLKNASSRRSRARQGEIFFLCPKHRNAKKKGKKHTSCQTNPGS